MANCRAAGIKKLHTCLGKVEVSKSHVLYQNTQTYGISSRLQELFCLLGQGYVFEEGEDILRQLPGIEVSARQIQRVSEHYGEGLEQQQEQYEKGEKEAPVLQLKRPEEPVYIMVDGSMVFTREEGWKEMKVGRIFNYGSCAAIQENRNEIMQSRCMCATWAGTKSSSANGRIIQKRIKTKYA